MAEEKKVSLGNLFPPLWLLGVGTIVAIALCVFIAFGVIDTEQRRAALKEDIHTYQNILNELPAKKLELTDRTRELNTIKSDKLALEQSIERLRKEKRELDKIFSQRDRAVT